MEKRTFIPGSEWVYFKLYTGLKTADTILKNEIYYFCKEMMNNGTINKWFFIRYTDPDFHIRLRLHLSETKDFSCIFNRFFVALQPLVNVGLMWNIQCDTYNREMERYGHNTISLIEDIFCIDSEYIIRLLQLLNNDSSEQLRWKSALVLIDSFLSAFSFDLPQRKQLSTMTVESYKKELGFTHHHTTKPLNDKYRSFRKDIEAAMLWENDTSDIISIIKARRQAIILLAEKLKTMQENGDIQVQQDLLLTSLIHMSMNRLFRAQNRLHEMVIYEFLSRYYAGEMAKNKFNPQK